MSASELGALLQWASARGAFLEPRLRVAEGAAAGRGLVAAAAIPPGTTLVFVPRSLLLAGIDAGVALHGPTNALAVRLLDERARGAASEYAKFIAALPRAFGTPLYFNDTASAALRGSDVLEWARSREVSVARAHERLFGAPVVTAIDANGASSSSIGGSSALEPSVAELRWALSIVWSRSVGIDARLVPGQSGTMMRLGPTEMSSDLPSDLHVMDNSIDTDCLPTAHRQARRDGQASCRSGTSSTTPSRWLPSDCRLMPSSCRLIAIWLPSNCHLVAVWLPSDRPLVTLPPRQAQANVMQTADPSARGFRFVSALR